MAEVLRWPSPRLAALSWQPASFQRLFSSRVRPSSLRQVSELLTLKNMFMSKQRRILTLKNSPVFFTGLALATAFAFVAGVLASGASLAASTSGFVIFAGISASTGFGAARFLPLAGVAEALLVDGIGSGAFSGAFGVAMLAA